MSNSTRQTFQALFEHKLRLLRNPACDRCDASIKHPLLPWLVGSRFAEGKERIFFVGKPHRGVPGEILPSGIIDPTDDVEGGLWDYGWAYWSYTREIAERIYGPRAMDFIVLTNLIKCTNTDGVDETSPTMAECCVGDLHVIWHEIALLKAKTVVFYTYSLFPWTLRDIPLADPDSIRNVTPENHTVRCRSKRLGWWERICRTEWTKSLRVLVVGHPERKGRREFVELLCRWIRRSSAEEGELLCKA